MSNTPGQACLKEGTYLQHTRTKKGQLIIFQSPVSPQQCHQTIQVEVMVQVAETVGKENKLDAEVTMVKTISTVRSHKPSR